MVYCRSQSSSVEPMSKIRSLSRSTVADAGSHDGGALRVPGLNASTWPSIQSTFATPLCRKWTAGYWPDGGSISGTSIRIGVPVGHGSIQVPALSANAIVMLVLTMSLILIFFQTGAHVGGSYLSGARYS